MDIKSILQLKEPSLYSSLPGQCALSISVENNALSLCLSDKSAGKIIAFEHWQTGEESGEYSTRVIELIDWLIKDYPWISADNITVTIALDAPVYSLVPLALFDPSQKESYLAIQHPGLKSGDWIYHDTIDILEAVLVYSLPLAVENRIKSAIPKAGILHAKSVLISSLLKIANSPVPKDLALVNIGHHKLEFIVIAEGNLRFFNEFRWETLDDLVYFILATLEKNHLDPVSKALNMTGPALLDESLLLHLQQFIPALSPMEIPGNFSFANVFGKLPKHIILPFISNLV